MTLLPEKDTGGLTGIGIATGIRGKVGTQTRSYWGKNGEVNGTHREKRANIGRDQASKEEQR